MADLSQLLYGATVAIGATTIGQVIDASGSFYNRDAPAFGDCDNKVQAIKVGRYSYGELSVRTVCGDTAGDASQLLLGSTFTWNSKLIGQLISIGGTFATRNTHEFSDCDHDAKTVLAGTYAYGPCNISAVYDPTATTGSFATWSSKAINATPTGSAILTLAKGYVLTGATSILTNLDIPGGGGPDDRLVIAATLQPVNGAAWVLTGTGSFGTLATQMIAADPTTTCTLTWADGSKIKADVGILTRLDFPTAGSESDRVVQSFSFRPTNGGVWTYTGKAK